MKLTLKALRSMSPAEALVALFGAEALKKANLWVLSVDAVPPTEKQADQAILGNLSASWQHVCREELKVVIRDMKVRKDLRVSVPGKQIGKEWHSHVLLKAEMASALSRRAREKLLEKNLQE